MTEEEIRKIIRDEMEKYDKYYRRTYPTFEVTGGGPTLEHEEAEYCLTTESSQGLHFYQGGIGKLGANKTIEIAPLAYMRGRTLHNSFMILDEAQNSTKMQMKMFLTRLGVTSKAIITGDITQIDLQKNEICGLMDAMKVLKNTNGISFIELTEKDVVRHRLVKDIIKAYNKENKK